MAEFEPEIEVRIRAPVPVERHPDFKAMAYDGYDVFRWPEFQALAARLGIDTSRPMRRLVIDLREGHMPIALIEQALADAVTSREERAGEADQAIKVNKGG